MQRKQPNSAHDLKILVKYSLESILNLRFFSDKLTFFLQLGLARNNRPTLKGTLNAIVYSSVQQINYRKSYIVKIYQTNHHAPLEPL